MTDHAEDPRRFAWLQLCLLALVSLSCVPEVDDSWRYPLGDDVDILLVVDNSASMASIQAELQEAFPSLVDALHTADVDWQLGVTTTDTDQDGNGGSGNVRSSKPVGAPGCGPQLARSSMESEESTWLIGQLVDVGIEGSTDESGLLAAALAMCKGKDAAFWGALSGLSEDDPVRRICDGVPEEDRGCNSGVFREDTPTLIVIVSDEGDASSVLPGSPPPLELEGCVQEHSDDPAFGQCECRLDWWHRFFQGIGREVVFVTVGPTYQLSTDEVALCDGSATSVAGPCNPFGSAVCPIDFYQRVACLTDGRFFPVLETIEPDQPATCEVADFGLIRDAIRDMLVGVAPDPS